MGSSMFRAWQLDPIRTMKAAFHGQELGQVPQKKRAQVEKNLGKDCVHFCLPGPTDTYARLFLGMLLDFDDTAPLFAKPAAESWQAHKRDARLQQRLSVPSMSSLAWWPLKSAALSRATPTSNNKGSQMQWNSTTPQWEPRRPRVRGT